MRAGAFLSAVGHAAAIGAAVWGLPWLRAHPEPPVPVVNVSFVSTADFAAAVAALSHGTRVPASPAPPAPVPAKRVEPPEPVEAPPEADEAPIADLAPAFDPAAPLGIGRSAAPPVEIDPPAVAAPRVLDLGAPFGIGRWAAQPAGIAQASVAAPEVAIDPPPLEVPPLEIDPPAAAAPRVLDRTAPPPPRPPASPEAGFEAAVRAAIVRARSYPGRARVGGISGTSRLHIVVARDGTLIAAQIAQSSGSLILDAASLAAARTAHLPAAPDELPGPSFSFEIGLAFTLTGD